MNNNTKRSSQYHVIVPCTRARHSGTHGGVSSRSPVVLNIALYLPPGNKIFIKFPSTIVDFIFRNFKMFVIIFIYFVSEVEIQNTAPWIRDVCRRNVVTTRRAGRIFNGRTWKQIGNITRKPLPQVRRDRHARADRRRDGGRSGRRGIGERFKSAETRTKVCMIRFGIVWKVERTVVGARIDSEKRGLREISESVREE